MSESRRVLAIDPGRRRFGVALSDPTRTLASPLTTLVRRPGKRPPIAAIERLVEDHSVALVVVGLPDPAEGADLQWVEEIRRFAERLEERTGVPVQLYDEAFSSVEATSRLHEGGRLARGDKGRVDAAAA
ncbi:MAG: Holliday junction resolvase RuvX, partial [Gemmatimonadota bacterium]|nr:Holliday junction resolvase RuvX [Gemmatimonadota bacterium]